MTLAFDHVGTGEPLVLIHPLGGDRHVWRPVLEYLTPTHECFCIDMPGFGESTPLYAGVARSRGAARPDFSPAALARAIGAWMDEQGLRGAAVAGNSLGGWVALELAYQGFAGSVTAIAPAGLWGRPLGPKPEIARRLARVLRPGLNGLVSTAGGRRLALLGGVAHADRVPPADARALIRAYALAPGFTDVNRAMRSGTFDHLRDIEVPVTLAWPEYDRLVPRLDHAPRSVRMIDLPDCGHIPMWDDPQAVAAVVRNGGQSPISHPAARENGDCPQFLGGAR